MVAACMKWQTNCTAIYGDLDGAGGEYLEKMRKTDIHDIPHSPYYTGNNTQ